MDDLTTYSNYMEDRPIVDRLDLTEDRKAYPHVMDDGFYRALITPGEVQYLCSSQFSIWRKAFLQKALVSGELPPHFEVEGSRRVEKDNPLILGTGYHVLPYSGDGVVWNGRVDNLHLEYLSESDRLELKEKGYV